MKNKKIVVLLKYFQGELNPFDGAALECALETGSKEITVVTMSPKTAMESFRSLTRLGVQGVFISDPVYAGSDTQATSLVLAEAIKRLNPDLVFCGRQSVDGDTAQVPPMLAQRLGFDFKAKVMEFDGETFTLRSGARVAPSEKCIVTFEKIRTLRFPSIFSKLGQVDIWDNTLLNIPIEKCGLKGSPTRVIKSYESSVGRRFCQFVSLEDLPTLIETGLKNKRQLRIENKGEKLEKAYFVGNVKSVAESIANEAVALDVSSKDPEKIAAEIERKNVKTVLFDDSEENKILAAKMAVLTGAGICADCISFRVEDKQLVMTRPALGGNVTADIICVNDIAFATVRTVKKQGSDVIFSIGKGAVDKLEKIEELAEKYNAEVCCSRIVADSGKLPYEKQVGLTGRTVSPKVYVAFGISGAVQHTCAIESTGMVIAVNSDKNARIFDYADYGIIADVNQL